MRVMVKVRKLATDLSLLRAEQRHLSPVNDFALYFKKDRAIIKLQEQYDQAGEKLEGREGFRRN